MEIHRITEPVFKYYGRILDLDTSDIIKAARKIVYPKEGSCYEPSLSAFEKLDISEKIKNECFGELDIQVGYCYGYNNAMNALEWHISSEVNIAVTDFILILGNVSYIENKYRYNSENTKAFLVKSGEAVEIYSTSMHFCPCMTDNSGFGCVVALPRGTNTPLDGNPKDKRLFRKNKWLLAHVDNKGLIERGVTGGIYGENYSF